MIEKILEEIKKIREKGYDSKNYFLLWLKLMELKEAKERVYLMTEAGK